ncbi:MAG: hypothetical protein K8T20_10640 [Planctomycetes bacterium]|nr:hypothetical protein [Planctomycetota bacterium]
MIAIEGGILLCSRFERAGSAEGGTKPAGVDAEHKPSAPSKTVTTDSGPTGNGAPTTPASIVDDYLRLMATRGDEVADGRPTMAQLRDRILRDPKSFLEEASKIEKLEGREAWQWADTLLMMLARLSPEQWVSLLPVSDDLVRKLRSDQAQERYLWAALARVSDQESVRVEVLRMASSDPEAWVRAKALETCAALSADARFGAVVLQAAREGSPACRPAAIRGLSSVNLPGAVAAICSGLDSPEVNIRSAAYESLVERARNDPDALAEISRLTNSPLDTEDAKRLWNELSRKSVLSKISREDLARLESLTGARR